MRAGLIAVVALGLVAPATAQGQRTGRSYGSRSDTTFAFASDGVVTIGRGAATIEVTGWDQPSIRVRGRGDDGLFTVTATPKRASIDPTRSSDDVTIQVWVPRGALRRGPYDVGRHHHQRHRGATWTRGPAPATSTSATLAAPIFTSLSGDVEVRNGSGSVTASTSNVATLTHRGQPWKRGADRR